MRIVGEGIKGSFKNVIVNRPWGYFGLYSDNEKCTTKILYIKPGQCLSMQLHIKRAQFYLLLDDDFTVEYSTKPVPFEMFSDTKEVVKWFDSHHEIYVGKAGSMFGFEKRTIHRIIYNGYNDYGRCLDLAFGENDEEDIIRLDDQYGR